MTPARIAGIAVGLLLAIQLVPVERTNPPVEQALEAPPDVQAIFDRACADCHSHATKWPWYAHVAPASWLVAHDVSEGRQHFNLSIWGGYSTKRQRKKAEQVWDEVEESDMPLPSYLLLHPEARLSLADRATLHAWSDAAVRAFSAGSSAR